MGHDVVAQPLEVRKRIGVVIQESAAELFLRVRDNLLTYARFHGISGPATRQRADRSHGAVRTHSGSMRKAQD